MSQVPVRIVEPKTLDEVIAYIKRRMGDCRVGIELTEQQIADACWGALEELSRWIPLRKITVKPISVGTVTPGQQSSVLGAPPVNEFPPETTIIKVDEYFDDNTRFRGIIEAVPNSDDISLSYSSGALGFGFPVPLDAYSPHNNFRSMNIWNYENAMMWIETLKNTFAVNFEWKFYEGYLYLWHLPSQTSKLMYVWTATRTLEEVDMKYRKWFVDFAFAQAQMTLAEIRGKISSGIPAPGGSMTLNADTIRSEAIERMRELREEIMYRSGSESLLWA